MPDAINPAAAPGVEPPQIDYRENPSAGGKQPNAHVSRDDPNVLGTVMPPQFDDSFMSYDTPGDALGKWNEMIHDQALKVG